MIPNVQGLPCRYTGEFSVKGFPTIKLIAAGKNGKRKVVEYKGGRTSKEIVEWALSQATKLALGRIGASPGEDMYARACACMCTYTCTCCMQMHVTGIHMM